MVYVKAYYFFKGWKLITFLKFIDSKCDNFRLFIVRGGVSLIISDQEDKSIQKILTMENWLPDIGFKT